MISPFSGNVAGTRANWSTYQLAAEISCQPTNGSVPAFDPAFETVWLIWIRYSGDPTEPPPRTSVTSPVSTKSQALSFITAQILSVGEIKSPRWSTCDRFTATETYTTTSSSALSSEETLIWILHKLHIVKRESKVRAPSISFAVEETILNDTIWCWVQVCCQYCLEQLFNAIVQCLETSLVSATVGAMGV